MSYIKTDYLIELIDQREWKALKEIVSGIDYFDLSEIIEALDDPYDFVLFRVLDRLQAKEVFELLPKEKQKGIVESFAQRTSKIADLLNDLDPDDRTAFFEELPGEITQRLITLLSSKERSIAVTLLGYPEDSIGRLMTPEYVAIKEGLTVKQALEHIRKFGRDSETLNNIYVVDKNWRLVDDIRIRDIILANPDENISDLMDGRFIALNAYKDQEEAVKLFKDYDRTSLPVIDSDGVLIGVVTIDDIIDVAEEEATEDFQKFGSFQDAIIDPLRARVGNLYKNRIVWLFALVFMNVFSGAAISSFEGLIESVVSLVFFLPLLIDSGGNAGSQSATLMIRALAMGNVQMKDWAGLIGKEVLVSLLLGITMAIGVALIASFRAPEIIIVVAASMVLTVMTGSLVGMLLPFGFTKLKLDPATASAPLITSIADISGVIIYFSFASWYLGI